MDDQTGRIRYLYRYIFRSVLAAWNQLDLFGRLGLLTVAIETISVRSNSVSLGFTVIFNDTEPAYSLVAVVPISYHVPPAGSVRLL